MAGARVDCKLIRQALDARQARAKCAGSAEAVLECARNIDDARAIVTRDDENAGLSSALDDFNSQITAAACVPQNIARQFQNHDFNFGALDLIKTEL